MAKCPVSDMFDIFAKTSLPLLVNPTGLANLQVTARLALSALRLDHVWQTCLSANFPRLAADSSCYELPQRHDLMSCYRFLHRVDRVILADSDRPIIRNGTEAKLLAKLLQGMEKGCTNHIDNTAPASCVLVGRLKVCDCDGKFKFNGFPTRFTLPSELHAAFGGSNTTLLIRFLLAPGFILVQAGERQASQDRQCFQHGEMIMHIKAACATNILNYRHVNVQADGRMQFVNEGVHFFPEFKNGTRKGDGGEVLCALSLRAGEGEHKRRRCKLASALQLDLP